MAAVGAPHGEGGAARSQVAANLNATLGGWMLARRLKHAIGRGRRARGKLGTLEVLHQCLFDAEIETEGAIGKDEVTAHAHAQARQTQLWMGVPYVLANGHDESADVGIVAAHRGLHERRVDDGFSHALSNSHT